ncbi:MAG: pyruvate kinase, partial [Lentisphaerae bacterium]|nr:pyruvate kinase [Lentisphaerota bacterium]
GLVEVLVETGGVLLQGKGVNFPDTDLKLPALTEKDKLDLAAAVDIKTDYISLSFVQRPEDMRMLADLAGPVGKRPMLIAKIEKPQAVEAFESILELSDAIMIARGDLGVEMSVARVPVLQKRIISQTNAAGKIVITATQMLESMTHNPRPTRAEASDVANAVWDGTDAVMLSGETAVGEYPIETVRTMRHIIFEAERSRPPRREVFSGSSSPAVYALAAASVDAANELNATGIIVITLTGYTAQMVIQRRPTVPVIAIVSDTRLMNQLALLWGGKPVALPWSDNTDDFLSEVESLLTTQMLIKQPGPIVYVSGSTKLRGTDYIMKIGGSIVGSN